MYPWEVLFEEKIKDRGYDYYRYDRIKAIKKTKSGYYANAHGTHTYQVAIRFHNGKVSKMNCTCPYAHGGTPCKHEAALLYKLSEESFQEKEKQHAMISIKEMEALSKEELQTYLLEHAQFDADIMHPLLHDVVYARNKAIEMVESWFDTYVQPYEDEIDEDFASDFYGDVGDNTIKRVRLLIARHQTTEAFVWLLSVKQALGNCPTVESGYGDIELNNWIENELHKLFQQASVSKRARMLQVLKRLELFQFHYFYQVCKPFLQHKQARFMKQREASYCIELFGIDEAKNIEAYGYALNDVVDCYKAYFKKQQDEASLTRFEQLVYQLALIREKMIIDALDQGKKQEAITILKDSIILDISSNQRIRNYLEAVAHLENKED